MLCATIEHKESPDANTAVLGLALLSWRGGDVLKRTLESYKKADLFSLFDRVLVLFQEINDSDREIAETYGLDYISTLENIGIEEGISMLARNLDTKYILLLENDCPLVEPREEVVRQLNLARRRLAAGEVDVYRLRHRWQPGEKFTAAKKYKRYHSLPGEGIRFFKLLLRFLRPRKYEKLIGMAPYVYEIPNLPNYKKYIKVQPEGDLIVSSEVLKWTNQSVLLKRSFLINEVLAHAKANPNKRTVHGFQDIEKSVNRKWWRQSNFKIGVNLGLFTHKRDFL